MTPQEALEESVSQLIDHMEKNYQAILDANNSQDNALKRHTYLTYMIELMDKAPVVEGIMKEALLLRLYTMRSEIAVNAEFIELTNGI